MTNEERAWAVMTGHYYSSESQAWRCHSSLLPTVPYKSVSRLQLTSRDPETENLTVCPVVEGTVDSDEQREVCSNLGSLQFIKNLG